MGHEALRELVGKQRTLEILDLLEEEGTQNFSDVERSIPTSSDVLSDRLQKLCDAGFVNRNEESKKDVRYTLTQDGQEFLRRIRHAESLLED